MRILLIRNAEHEFYSMKRWPVDGTGLSARGVEQSRLLRDRLKREPITAIVSSALTRAVETVHPLAEEIGLMMCREPAFNALNMGECSGLTHDQTRAALGEQEWVEVFSSPDPEKRYFRGGETLGELAMRAWDVLKDIAARSREDEVVVIGTHEEVVGALLCRMAGMPLSRLWWWGRRRSPLYASITEVLWERRNWQLIHFGCLEHLDAQ